MISQSDLKNLYKTISADLVINPFDEENALSFINRLVYSATARWVMSYFADRDFEDESLDSVSKMHVTLSGMSLIESYVKIDNRLAPYFHDSREFINYIEDTYETLGFINSGLYSYKYQTSKAKVRIADRVLCIDLDSNIKKIRGLGLWSKPSDGDVSLRDFLFAKENALDSFKRMTKLMKFDRFSSSNGKIEVYNTKHNRWDYFQENKIEHNHYYILKIDDGLDFKLLKMVNDVMLASSFPMIYSKRSSDPYFQHEIWRMVLGLCSFEGDPATCELSHYCGNGVKLRMGGYILPRQETALLNCMCWPLNKYDDINEYVTDSKMTGAIRELLESLSITIIEEKGE